MNLDKSQLKELAGIAEKAAQQAAGIIQQYRNNELQITQKQAMATEASSVVTQADLECQNVILEVLKDSISRYDLGILTEEMQDDQSRLVKDYFWCIDPLDGTLPFTENRPGYAVSIALVTKSGVPVIGIINHPVSNKSCTAIRDQGVRWDGLQPEINKQTQNDLVCYFDRSFLKHPQYKDVIGGLKQIKSELGFSDLQINTGAGAVMNAMSVLNHKNALYFKFPKKESGGGSLWDYAATACVYNEMNLWATDLNSEKINLNNADTTFMNENGILYTTQDRLAHKIINLHKQINR